MAATLLTILVTQTFSRIGCPCKTCQGIIVLVRRLHFCCKWDGRRSLGTSRGVWNVWLWQLGRGNRQRVPKPLLRLCPSISHRSAPLVPRLSLFFSTAKLSLVWGDVYLIKNVHEMEEYLLFHIVVRTSKDFSRNDLWVAGDEALKFAFRWC
jgi:hypothetical protein